MNCQIKRFKIRIYQTGSPSIYGYESSKQLIQSAAIDMQPFIGEDNCTIQQNLFI